MNQSDTKLIKTRIITELYNRPSHSITRSTLQKKMCFLYQSFQELDMIMALFDECGMIRTVRNEGETIYVMPLLVVEEYKRLFEKKQNTIH